MFGMGMPELIFIFIAALIIFGPRKLPEIGRTLGHAMNQFRNASNEFKRVWENEVEVDNKKKHLAQLSNENQVLKNGEEKAILPVLNVSSGKSTVLELSNESQNSNKKSEEKMQEYNLASSSIEDYEG